MRFDEYVIKAKKYFFPLLFVDPSIHLSAHQYASEIVVRRTHQSSEFAIPNSEPETNNTFIHCQRKRVWQDVGYVNQRNQRVVGSWMCLWIGWILLPVQWWIILFLPNALESKLKNATILLLTQDEENPQSIQLMSVDSILSECVTVWVGMTHRILWEYDYDWLQISIWDIYRQPFLRQPIIYYIGKFHPH